MVSGVLVSRAPAVFIDDAGRASVLWLEFAAGAARTRFADDLAGGWSAPVELAPSNVVSGNDVVTEPMVFGAANTGFAGWFRRESLAAHERFYVASPSANGWSAAVAAEGTPSALDEQPVFAANAAGLAVAVWTRFDAVYASVRSAAGQWSAAKPIHALVGASADFPAVAVDASGSAVAVWRQTASGASASQIHGSRLDSGVWSVATRIDAGSGSAARPQVAALGGGQFLSVWEDVDGTRTALRSARGSGGSAWLPPERLPADAAGNAFNPRLSSVANGAVIAVWEQTLSVGGQGLPTRVRSARFAVVTGTWTLVGDVAVGLEANNNWRPRIAVATDGSAIAVWRNDAVLNGRPMASHYSPTPLPGRWSTPINLDDAGVQGGEAEVWRAPGGASVVAWVRQRGVGSDQIMARVFQP